MTLQKFSGNLQKEIVGKKGILIVKYFATWCGPCKLLAPIVEQVSNERKEIQFIEVDVDQHTEAAIHFNVMSVPTVIVLKDGQEKGRMQGYVPKEEFKKRLETFLK